MCDKEKKYIIKPNYKKSVYEKEEWNNTLKNGKKVSIIITTFYRSGSFEISLTNEEKDEIIGKNEICFDNYYAEMIEMWDGCDLYVDIDKYDTFSESEIKEIKTLIYCNNNQQYEYESDEENSFDIEILENNGWISFDTTYGFSCGCILEEITDD
jgi:hypothetical protein